MTSMPEMCLYVILATGVGLSARRAFEIIRDTVGKRYAMPLEFKRLFEANNCDVTPEEIRMNGKKSDPNISSEEMTSGEKRSSGTTDTGAGPNLNPKDMTLDGETPSEIDGGMSYIDLFVSEKLKNDLIQVLHTADRIEIITGIYGGKGGVVKIERNDKDIKAKLDQIPNGIVVNIEVYYPEYI